MRRKRERTVKLVVLKHGLEREFEVKHAERLLDMGTFLNGGWELPSDSEFTYNEENGLRLKSDKADS